MPLQATSRVAEALSGEAIRGRLGWMRRTESWRRLPSLLAQYHLPPEGLAGGAHFARRLLFVD